MSQAKAELKLMTERKTELQHEVCLHVIVCACAATSYVTPNLQKQRCPKIHTNEHIILLYRQHFLQIEMSILGVLGSI